MNKTFYRGWLIEVIAEPTGYSFQCWLPGGRVAVSDRHTYSTPQEAHTAARRRADLEAIRWALEHCYEIYQQGQLALEEYETLEHLIVGALTRTEHPYSFAS